MLDNEFIEDLANDISSWDEFYIIVGDETGDIADKFSQMLIRQDINCVVIDEGMADIFNENLNEGDCVLVVSKNGREDYIRAMVKTSLKKNVKVYAICSDFRSPLALFAEEIIIIKEIDDFEEVLLSIFDDVCANLSKDVSDDEYEISTGAEPAPREIPKDAILSSMHGRIIEIRVHVGDSVEKGDVLFVIEAMKMENEVLSELKGVVEEIYIKTGDYVAINDAVMLIK